MLVTKIAVFLENRAGRLAELTKVLSDNNINLMSLSITDGESFGIMRAVTDNNELALKVLKESGFNTSATELLAFEIDNKAGALAKVLKVLTDASVNVGYLQSYSSTDAKTAVVMIKASDNESATKALTTAKVKLVSKL